MVLNERLFYDSPRLCPCLLYWLRRWMSVFYQAEIVLRRNESAYLTHLSLARTPPPFLSTSQLDGVCNDTPAEVITATPLICFHIRVTVKTDLSSLGYVSQ